MARKSRIEPVRKFLEEAKTMTAKEQDAAARTERFHDAEIYKAFKNVLLRALELCGEEKPKEISELKARLNFIQNSSGEMFVPPENSQNRGED